MGDQETAEEEPLATGLAAIETLDPRPEGTGLCLSGGGSRAMLFHVGALWRMNELGLLRHIDRVSSVSGGSITAGVLATRWTRLTFDPATGSAMNFADLVVAPIRRLADKNLDVMMVIKGLLLPRTSPAGEYAKALAKHLYGEAILQDLPERPRFVFNATNLQSTVLWRFSRPYAWDYRVGKIPSPRFPVAVAVAASGAFPPFFSPLRLDLEPTAFEAGTGDERLGPDFRRRVFLADGGAYDNLGLETVLKRCATVYVSDGGGKVSDETSPSADWIRGTLRATKIIDNQVRSLRKRLLIDAYTRGDRVGAYWGIRSAIMEAPAPGSLPCPPALVKPLAEMPTRLARITRTRQEALINWGYAIADASIRHWHLRDAPAPTGFPYAVGLG
jgi:NTE family protein